jgi:four helix bundle protein
MNFKDLIVWQKGMVLVKVVYEVTNQLPENEKYGLTSQARRAAVSIPTNIAEGRKRRSRSDFVQFLRIADGSVAELETLMLLIKQLYPSVDVDESWPIMVEIQKMINVMIRKLSS